MYNVLVADDEKNIREGIMELIEWEELECRVCACMRNGEQVLEYLESGEQKIDLVITDIKMPIMDGMELAGVLRDRYPEIKVIILTAYSDFTYAQQAIKCQVADFVIKNEFFSELPRAVRRIVKQWEAEGRKGGGEKKDFFIRQGSCRVCACEVESRGEYDPEGFEKNLEDLALGIFQDRNIVLLTDESELLIIIVEESEKAESDLWFKRKLEKLVSLAGTFQNTRLRIGVSGIVKNEECMSQGKKQALRSLSDIYTDEKPVNIGEERMEYLCGWAEDGDVDGYMRSLYIALRSGRKDELEKKKNEYREYLKKPDRPIEQCRSDTHAVISYLIRKIRNAAHGEKALAPDSILDAVYKSKTKAALYNVMRDTCSGIASFLSVEEKGQNSLVRKVDGIIRRSYQEKLSLKDISRELFVNSSYLSRVYKKETGNTVTDAVNRFRIKKAKEILETGNYKVYEAGKMVGIEDPAYFTHVFLKYEGESPSDYMNKKNEC